MERHITSQKHSTSIQKEQEVHPRTGYEGPEGKQRYSSNLSLTSSLDGVSAQRHSPAASPSGMTRYSLQRRLRGPHGRSGGCGNLASPHQDSNPYRPGRSKSLYGLCYASHNARYFIRKPARPFDKVCTQVTR